MAGRTALASPKWRGRLAAPSDQQTVIHLSAVRSALPTSPALKSVKPQDSRVEPPNSLAGVTGLEPEGSDGMGECQAIQHLRYFPTMLPWRTVRSAYRIFPHDYGPLPNNGRSSLEYIKRHMSDFIYTDRLGVPSVPRSTRELGLSQSGRALALLTNG